MTTPVETEDLAFAGAARHASAIAAGELSSRDLTQMYLDRIARLDPQLNAWRVVLAESALAEADAADARRAAGETAGVLNGVPVAIKDNVDVAGQTTPAGTSAHGPAATQDAAVVTALRAAGAVILGKTNVPELLASCFTETLTFGATRNPWDTTRTPGGSSGGSGAALAAGLCSVALGSDGAGSIRIPAAWCGLFGLKPQRDRISLAPNDDGWHGLSVYGPIARTAADAALFLDATATSAPSGGFLAAAGRAPGPLRIAVATNLPPGSRAKVSADATRAVDETVALLRELGHTMVTRDLDYGTAALTLTARYLSGIAQDAAGMAHPDRLERRTQGMARLGRLIPPAALARARAAEAGVAARMQRIYEVADVVLTPGPAAAPFRIGELQGRGALRTIDAMSARVPFYGAINVTGQPAASVPAGWDADGLPLAVQFVGRPDDEATLLSLAAQIEQARPWTDRRPPVA